MAQLLFVIKTFVCWDDLRKLLSQHETTKLSKSSVKCYQLAFLTPGNCPLWASWRKLIRLTPNLRM